MTDQRTTRCSAPWQDTAPDTGLAGRLMPPASLSPEQLLRVVRTGVVPPGCEPRLFAFLDGTNVATLAYLITGGVGTYAEFAALADRILPENHDTRTWLNERLGRGTAARSGEPSLLDLVLPALDHVFASRGRVASPEWTLGGGLALALQLGHRISCDALVSVRGARLQAFTPALNPATARLSSYFEWTGHQLKFEMQDGSITFVSAPLQTEPGYEWQTVQGRVIATQTPEEVVVNAIRCRSERFTARDAFDLAALGETEPGLERVLAAEVPDALPRLAESMRALEARGTGALSVSVVPTDIGAPLLADAFGRARRIVSRAASLARLTADGLPPVATR